MRRRKRKRSFTKLLLVIFFIAFIAIAAKYSFSDVLKAGSAQVVDQGRPIETADILLLVNKENKLPDGFEADLTTVEGAKVSRILAGSLKEMIEAAKKEKVYINIAESYRTKADQEQIFNDTVFGYVKQGNSQNVALERANLVAALPGYSEHETGLAIDFSFGVNADKQAEMWDWLSENAYKYGFILRYPEGKEHITGYSYEPWHYRYVGKEHAKAIYEQDLVLEEYLNCNWEYLKSN